MITVRSSESIHVARGEIEKGSFEGHWHFSFGEYYDPRFVQFGTLRVFNDDTLSPGATWPLHPHRDIEVVTYCAGGEFRHADQQGKGGILQKGWVQHTTVGSGMLHSEINNRDDIPMRFIQMWFIPEGQGLEPSVEQKRVSWEERANKFLPLVSNHVSAALPIKSDAEVFSCLLEKGRTVSRAVKSGRGCYLYVVEGGPVGVDGYRVEARGAAMIADEERVRVSAEENTELLLVDVAAS